MALSLYAHPLSSYCQKVLVALYETGIAFTYRELGADPTASEEMAALWPIGRFPVLVDDGRTVVESSIIIEHLALAHGGGALLPADPAAALDVRFMDRFFDCYVMTPMQEIVFDMNRPADVKDPYGVGQKRAILDRAYAWADEALAGRTYAAGETFTMADCAAAPSLLYADWVHPIPERHATLRAYRTRLFERPSVRRAIEEARPFRHLFPMGDVGRD